MVSYTIAMKSLGAILSLPQSASNSAEGLAELEDPEFRVTIGSAEELTVMVKLARGRMQEFAAQTGGAVYIPRSADDLDNAFAQIAADLAQQYILSYYPAADKRDGKYHLIMVRVKTRQNTRVRARKGFLVKTRDQA